MFISNELNQCVNTEHSTWRNEGVAAMVYTLYIITEPYLQNALSLINDQRIGTWRWTYVAHL